ncbi:MAG: acyl-CoA/acyl-ACP dehydrogenase [Novosphingobium sp.]|nr:acyl-CoA/acyl-ACP dehydrogenase [Novosphingobium sp.]
MDVVLSENQTLLQQATRRFVDQEHPVLATRKLAEAGSAFAASSWQACAAQGWIGLFVPAEHGGMAEDAEGVIDAAIVAEELGRQVFAGPFASNAVVAFAIANAGSEVQRATHLPGLVSGETQAAWCFAGTGAQDGLGPDALTVSGNAISGAAGFVENGASADLLLVSARDGIGLSQFLIPADHPGITIEPLRSLDLGRGYATVRFDSVEVDRSALLGDEEAASAQFERQLQLALVLQCAETIGLIDRAFEFTLEWVRQRHAFGRPIGSFQALKHRLADHTAEFEAAKAAVAYAAKAVQNRSSDAAIAVSIAKSQCGKQGVEIVRDCVQMHGGVGLTWEHDLHFYLRRAVANQSLLGTPAMHHERIALLAGIEGDTP